MRSKRLYACTTLSYKAVPSHGAAEGQCASEQVPDVRMDSVQSYVGGILRSLENERLRGNPAFKKLLKRLAIILVPVITVALASKNKQKIVALLQKLSPQMPISVSIDVSVENLGGEQFDLSIPKGYQKTVYELKCVHEQQKGVPAYLLQYYRKDSEQPLIDNTQLTPGESLIFITDHYCKRIGESLSHNRGREREKKPPGAPSSRSANDLLEAFKTGIHVAYEKLGGDTVFGQLSQDAYLLNLPSNTIYNGIRMKDLEYTSNNKRKRSTSSRSKSSSTTDRDKDSICFVCIQITDYWVVTFLGYQDVDWTSQGEYGEWISRFPVEKSTWSLRVEGYRREVKPGAFFDDLVEWRDHLFYTVGDFIELGEIRGRKQWIVLNNLIYFMNNQPDSRLYVIELCDSTKYKVLLTNWVFDTETQLYSKLVNLIPNKDDKTCKIIYSDKEDESNVFSYKEDSLVSTSFKRFIILDDVTDAYKNDVPFFTNADKHYPIRPPTPHWG